MSPDTWHFPMSSLSLSLSLWRSKHVLRKIQTGESYFCSPPRVRAPDSSQQDSTVWTKQRIHIRIAGTCCSIVSPSLMSHCWLDCWSMYVHVVLREWPFWIWSFTNAINRINRWCNFYKQKEVCLFGSCLPSPINFQFDFPSVSNSWGLYYMVQIRLSQVA